MKLVEHGDIVVTAACTGCGRTITLKNAAVVGLYRRVQVEAGSRFERICPHCGYRGTYDAAATSLTFVDGVHRRGQFDCRRCAYEPSLSRRHLFGDRNSLRTDISLLFQAQDDEHSSSAQTEPSYPLRYAALLLHLRLDAAKLEHALLARHSFDGQQ